jgi:hypothetical protein
MHWSFDIDTRKLTTPADGLGVRSVGLAFPDRYPVTLDVTRGTEAYSFTGDVVLVLRPLMGQLGVELAKAVLPVASGSTAEGVFSLSTEPLGAWLPSFGDSPAVLEVLVLDEEGSEVASLTVRATVSRRFGEATGTPDPLDNGLATQAEAEAGASNLRWMSPLRVAQAIAALAEGDPLTELALNSLGFYKPLFSVKASDQSVTSSTVLVNCTSLTLPVAANGTYRFELGLIGTENGGGVKCGFIVPSSAVTHGKWVQYNGSTPAYANTSADFTDPYGIIVTAGADIVTANQSFLVVTGATAGSVTLQFAQVTSDVSNSTIKAGSWIKAERVA